MVEAQWIWRQFPNELSVDLARYYHRRIAEWHDGSMCSYELLELAEYLPDEGVFKTAVRDGEWCDKQYALFQAANELAILRASQVPGADADAYGARLFIPPYKIRQRAERNEEVEEGRQSIFAMVSYDEFDDAEREVN